MFVRYRFYHYVNRMFERQEWQVREAKPKVDQIPDIDAINADILKRQKVEQDPNDVEKKEEPDEVGE